MYERLYYFNYHLSLLDSQDVEIRYMFKYTNYLRLP